MKRFGLVVLLSACAWQGAWAQASTPPQPGEARIERANDGKVEVRSDVLAAEMAVEATATSAQAAQRQVNDVMSAGINAAQAVPGVEIRAVAYSVQMVFPSGSIVGSSGRQPPRPG